ncbi:kinesin-like protein [Achlya hypogyna]|uniref:Kinesin-like protein n=1 Tax=Achlya hypogyna TaxID=1202772 RepID=A0A1V9ZJJ7_ACHHY|nr:kinesin-like protein [Achlya hypogyna]
MEAADVFRVASDTCLVATTPRVSRLNESVVTFHFTHVFRPETTQQELFAKTTQSIVEEALEGKNGLVFAYGVTNSGKTHTILGNNDNPGIIPETFAYLFQHTNDFDVTASYLEIYNEKVYDLIAPANPKRAFLQLQEKDGRVHVKDLEERRILSYADAKATLEHGQKNRQVAETRCNSDSSRSHCVFSLQIYRKNDPKRLWSKISIVDLAGCERGAKTGASGLRLQEASNINKSLMNLNQCLETLRWNQQNPKAKRPVPFRSSKLTRLFQESLVGGHTRAGRIIMIVAVNPSNLEFEETLRTLEYGAIAKDVVTAPIRPTPRKSLAKTEYDTDGHKKRKRPSAPSKAENVHPNVITEGTTSKHLKKAPKRAPARVTLVPAARKSTAVDKMAELTLLREENKSLRLEMEAKDAEYFKQEIRVRKKLVTEMTLQMDDLKASYEEKIAELNVELETTKAQVLTLTDDKWKLETLCEKLQEQVDECEDEIRRMDERHKEELAEFQTAFLLVLGLTEQRAHGLVGHLAALRSAPELQVGSAEQGSGLAAGIAYGPMGGQEIGLTNTNGGMAKGNKKKSGDNLAVVGRSVSKLVSAEEASEMEILNTPVMSARREDDSHDDEDEEEEDDEEEIERRLVEEMEAKKNATSEESAIYNKDALLRLAGELDLKQKFAWVETLDTCKFPLELTNAHDDLKREVAFYNQTLASVKDAKARLLKEKVPYKRPEDYFAEMLKSDAHMARVKDKLIYEQKKIAAVEERKKSQAHKKVAKELQSQKAKQRLQEKNDTLDAVKQWKKRKNTNNSGGTVVEDDDGSFDKMLDGANKRKREGDDRGDNKRPKVNKKREAANKRWGSGGKTRADKKNSKKSTNDMSSFSRARNNDGVGKRAAPKGAKRPGKMARGKNNQKRGRK